MSAIQVSQPITLFISYSHDSSEHEQRVLALSDRLRDDGVDANLDQYESAPADGWSFWMEVRYATLVLCWSYVPRRTCASLRIGKNPRRAREWSGKSISSTIIFIPRSCQRKFIPVLLEGASPEDIPLPLRGFTYYRVGTAEDYDKLYRRLTNQPLVSKRPLGKLRRLPAREKSPDSLPGAFSLEQLSKTMSNPRYADDIFKLDRIYDRHAVINKETIIIVVGTSIIAELLDRPTAELLRDHIDLQGGSYPFRRGIVITDETLVRTERGRRDCR